MKVFRYPIPVDDTWYDLPLTGPVVKVDTRGEDYVELWAIAREGVEPVQRRFKVYGTGHPVPDHTKHVGSALAPSGTLVWHLFERCFNHDTDAWSDTLCDRVICDFCSPLGAKR